MHLITFATTTIYLAALLLEYKFLASGFNFGISTCCNPKICRITNAHTTKTKIFSFRGAPSKLNLINNGNADIQNDIKTTNENEIKENQKIEQVMEDEPPFDSLDVVLERARKRKIILLPMQLQALANKPVIKLGNIYLTTGDCALIAIALKLGSVGFSIGYVIGKSSTPIISRSNLVPIMFVQLWTGALAVVSDIIWNNLF